MGQALYRKYRPQLFAEVVEQTHIVKILSQQLKDGAFSHAYLFSGPRGTGKTTLARIVAKRLNCQNPLDGEPCNQCSSCLAINENRSLDFIEIDAASNRGINEIRELKESVKTGTSGSNYKVFVIDEAHMLTTEAFNALLKTLEEPPAHAIFILATTELHKIPDTIASRCQQFRFSRVSLPAIASLLAKICQQENLAVDETVLKMIARRSGGYVRDAVSLLSQLVILTGEQITLTQAEAVLPRSSWTHVVEYTMALLKFDGKKAMQAIIIAANEGVDLEVFVADALELVRLLIIGVIVNEWNDLDWLISADDVDAFKRLLKPTDLGSLSLLTDVLLEAHGRAGAFGVAELPLQAATAKFLNRQVKNNNEPPADNHTGSGSSGNGIISTVEAVSMVINKNEKELNSDVEKNQEIEVAPKVNLSEVVADWLLVIKDIRQYNQTLAGFLQTARPIKLENGQLTISFSYGFHWDKLREPKNQKMLTTVLAVRWPGDWKLKGEISQTKHESLPLPVISQDGEATNDSAVALEVFAGQVAV